MAGAGQNLVSAAPAALPEAFLRTANDVLQLSNAVKDQKSVVAKAMETLKKLDKDLSSVKKSVKGLKEASNGQDPADMEQLTKVLLI